MSESMSMRPAFRALLLAVTAVTLVHALPAAAASAVLAKNGTLYEVASGPYGTFFDSTDPLESRVPVLVLRTTMPDGTTDIEVIQGTYDANGEGSASVEFEETTQTVFVVYMQYQGLMSDVHFALKRRGRWSEQTIDPNRGLYLSLNPSLLVTRQRYIDSDGQGGTVTKQRSILSIVWWEESGVSQARYTAAFIEDGALDLDNLVTVNLSELSGANGPTDASGLPFSSYQYPALQRDPSANGGVFAAFANLSSHKHEVYRITFPDDLTKLGDGSRGAILARGRIPIGGRVHEGGIPSQINVPGPVGTVLSPSGAPTFYWEDTVAEHPVMRFLDGDSETGAPISIPLRADFSMDRALTVLRAMVDKQQ